MATSIKDIEALLDKGIKQGYLSNQPVLSVPKDPDFMAILNQFAGYLSSKYAGLTWGSEGNRIVFYLPQPTDKKNPDDPNNPDNPGGGGGGGSGGGGASISSAYQHLAAGYGIHLTGGQINALMTGQVSIDEFHQRLLVIQRLKDNKTFLDQFEHEVKAEGLGNFKFSDRVDFVLNQKPASFYTLWNTTAGRSAFVEAGFDIGGKGDFNVGRHGIQRILGDLGLTGPEGAGQAEAALATVAQQYAQIAETLPDARWLGFGISKRERERLSEGKASAGTMAKFTRLQATIEAESKPLASGQFQPQRGQAQPQY